MEPNTLFVHINNARGLYLKNHTTLDAFVTVVLHGKGSLRSRAVTEQVSTQCDCRWDEYCEFKLSDESTHLTVTVQNKAKFGRSDVIGKCEFSLEQAKKIFGLTWFTLKKKKDDDKYRGEIQLQFTFSYEKPSLSISNSSLNRIEKDGMLDKMKRKMKGAVKHRKAEDTMSVTSGVSGISITSSRSSRFISRINKSITKKLSSLHPDGHHSLGPNSTNTSCDTNDGSVVPYNDGASSHDDKYNTVSRPVSVMSGIDFNEEPSSVQQNVLSTSSSHTPQFIQNAYSSPTASTAESFHRANSCRSVASSGFGGSNKPMKQKKR
ncbi:hypothetical protein KIN20_029548 [Parelaphostrongylus tenuis]|uniref:C2 domain-containing protein n=1 Tax=Parelaphostrongylus tenuis TaxID=148309 RepID=A0AAD5WFP9_PARTN|nr:hypothetical protein KIN20_029548 [Parelaphostrongylus tenuis]